MFYLTHNQTPFYATQFNNFFITHVYVQKLYTNKVYFYYMFLFINKFPPFFFNKLQLFTQIRFGSVSNYFISITWPAFYWTLFINTCLARELPYGLRKRQHLSLIKKELFFATVLYDEQLNVWCFLQWSKLFI